MMGGKVKALAHEEFTLVGSHRITATDLLDQYMVWRLKDTINDCEAYMELEDIRLACRVLLRFMGENID
jgi:hypothetical protein